MFMAQKELMPDGSFSYMNIHTGRKPYEYLHCQNTLISDAVHDCSYSGEAIHISKSLSSRGMI